MIIAVVLSILCATTMGDDEFYQKYALIKVFSDCFGENNVLQWKQDMINACHKCHQMDVNYSLDLDSPGYIKDAVLHPHQRTYVPLYYIQQSQPQQHLTQGHPFYGSSPFHQQVPLFHTLGKRSASFTREGFNQMKRRITAKISNITCILRDMNLIDKENMPNYTYMQEILDNLQISEELRHDIREGEAFCREFSMCVPVERLRNPLAKEFGYAFAFLKCMAMKKMQACMKQDLKRYSQRLVGFEEENYLRSVLLERDDGHPETLMKQIGSILEGKSLLDFNVF